MCLRGISEDFDYECPYIKRTHSCNIDWYSNLSKSAERAFCKTARRPACKFWAGSWTDHASCDVHSYTEEGTVCACKVTSNGSKTKELEFGMGIQVFTVPDDLPVIVERILVIFNYHLQPQMSVMLGVIIAIALLLLGGIIRGQVKDIHQMLNEAPPQSEYTVSNRTSGRVDNKSLPPLTHFSYKAFCSRFWDEMKKRHSWVSVHFTFVGHFSRTQRLCCIACHICGVLMFIALGYDLKSPDRHCQQFSSDFDARIRGDKSSCLDLFDRFHDRACLWDPDPEACYAPHVPLASMVIAAFSVLAVILQLPVDMLVRFLVERMGVANKVYVEEEVAFENQLGVKMDIPANPQQALVENFSELYPQSKGRNYLSKTQPEGAEDHTVLRKERDHEIVELMLKKEKDLIYRESGKSLSKRSVKRLKKDLHQQVRAWRQVELKAASMSDEQATEFLKSLAEISELDSAWHRRLHSFSQPHFMRKKHVRILPPSCVYFIVFAYVIGCLGYCGYFLLNRTMDIVMVWLVAAALSILADMLVLRPLSVLILNAIVPQCMVSTVNSSRDNSADIVKRSKHHFRLAVEIDDGAGEIGISAAALVSPPLKPLKSIAWITSKLDERTGIIERNKTQELRLVREAQEREKQALRPRMMLMEGLFDTFASLFERNLKPTKDNGANGSFDTGSVIPTSGGEFSSGTSDGKVQKLLGREPNQSLAELKEVHRIAAIAARNAAADSSFLHPHRVPHM